MPTTEPVPERVLSVPFHTQHWDLDVWSRLGFTSRDDAEYWQKSCCGILCLQMTFEFLLHRDVLFQDLLQTGLRLHAYTDQHGWSHQGLCAIATEYGCLAAAKPVGVEELRAAIDQNRLPIVSIKWALQNTKTLKEQLFFWKKYGGHLAVVVGYRFDHGVVTHLYLHHTSKIEEQNWVARPIPIKEFIGGYTGRAIMISQQRG